MNALTDARAVAGSIGRGVERLEDLRLLTGRGAYVDDLRRPDMLHAAILRSSVAHGRIVSIDPAPALGMPGVRAVITAADIGAALGAVPRIPMRQEALPELEPYEQPVIAHGKVRYVGEPLAVVVADDPARAEDALEAIVVEIETLPAVAGRGAAERPDALLYEETGTNCALTLAAVRGDADAAFAAAPYVRRERFRVHRHSALPMETRGILADWDGARGRLTVLGASKVPFPNRRVLSQQLRLAVEDIDMVEGDTGGGFGVRGEFYPEDFLIPFAAKHLGRPVKWIEDRREHLIAANHAREAECEIELACTRDGRIVALRAHAHTDVGAYLRTNGLTPSRNVAQVSAGPYAIEHVHFRVSAMLTNKTPVGTYRGPGRFETDFFRERLFDMVAADLGLDRVEFRRRNLVRAHEIPWKLATVQPFGGETSTDSGDYEAALQRCLAEFDWTAKARLDGRRIDGRYHGIAVGCYIEGGASGPREGARLVMENDDTVSVYTGSSSVGQGLETVFAQIAADALAIPMESIRGVFHGSTAGVTEGFGSYSSRSVVMGGSAIVEAAKKLKAMMEETPDVRPLVSEASFSSMKRTYSYGTHAAHVAVDPDTGGVQVIDYVAVEDVGRIINPETLHGQTVGAIVQGLGGVFLEHLAYDADGQLLAGSLADYLMPGAMDFPEIRVIANAIASALRSFAVQPRELPLSPPRVWALVNKEIA